MKGRHATNQRPALAPLRIGAAILITAALTASTLTASTLTASALTSTTTLPTPSLAAFASLAILPAWRWRRLVIRAGLTRVAQLNFCNRDGGVLDGCKQLSETSATSSKLRLCGQRIHRHHVRLFTRTLRTWRGILRSTIHGVDTPRANITLTFSQCLRCRRKSPQHDVGMFIHALRATWRNVMHRNGHTLRGSWKPGPCERWRETLAITGVFLVNQSIGANRCGVNLESILRRCSGATRFIWWRTTTTTTTTLSATATTALTASALTTTAWPTTALTAAAWSATTACTRLS